MAKFLLLLGVLLVAVWVWRQGRRPRDVPPPPAAPTQGPVVMVACRHCGTHLPQSEAVAGQLGPYCCQDHWRLSEGR